jgi:hypothetical protein
MIAPLLATKLYIPAPRASDDLVRRYAAAFDAVQAELAGLSSVSRIFVAERSGHSIQIDEPQRVVEAIGWVLDQVAWPPAAV